MLYGILNPTNCDLGTLEVIFQSQNALKKRLQVLLNTQSNWKIQYKLQKMATGYYNLFCQYVRAMAFRVYVLPLISFGAYGLR